MPPSKLLFRQDLRCIQCQVPLYVSATYSRVLALLSILASLTLLWELGIRDLRLFLFFLPLAYFILTLMASAKLFRVIVPVSSIKEAATYYSAVLEQSGMRISPGRHYFDCGGTILACFDPRADGDAWDATPNPDHLYFAVDDLEAYHARVGKQPNGSILRSIETQPWGERSFYCADPFGNKLCFVDERTLFTGR